MTSEPARHGAGALDPAGFVRIGPYRVVRCIGAGGSGWVFEAEHRGQLCALKLLKPWAILPGQDREAFLRFEREVRILRELRHPALVEILDSGAEPRVELAGGGALRAPLYYTMPLCARSLEERVARDGPLGEAEIEPTFGPLLAALGALHARGVVHRDVKPANVLLDAQGRPLLADLGVARELDAVATHTGMLLGTPAWMAPEQASGARSVGPRSDLFSLGMTLLFALRGRVPYADMPGVGVDDPERIRIHLILAARQRRDLALPFDLTDVPSPAPPGRIRAPLRAAIRRATRVAPEARYADAASLADDLVRALRAPRPEIEPREIVRVAGRVVRRFRQETCSAWDFEVEPAGARGRASLLRVLEPGRADGDADLHRAVSEALSALEGLPGAPACIERPALVAADGRSLDAPCAVELPPGRSLASIQEASASEAAAAPLAHDEVIRVLLGVLDPLERLHRSGRVHGDLGPHNLWIDPGGRPFLGPPALPRVEPAAGLPHACRADAAWQAPEQWTGGGEPASDVFVLGLTLAWALAGTNPLQWIDGIDVHDGAALAAWLRTRGPGDALSLHCLQEARLDAAARQAYEPVLRRALRLRAADRHASAGALARDLERALRSVVRGRDRPRTRLWPVAAVIPVPALLALWMWAVDRVDPDAARPPSGGSTPDRVAPGARRDDVQAGVGGTDRSGSPVDVAGPPLSPGTPAAIAAPYRPTRSSEASRAVGSAPRLDTAPLLQPSQSEAVRTADARRTIEPSRRIDLDGATGEEPIASTRSASSGGSDRNVRAAALAESEGAAPEGPSSASKDTEQVMRTLATYRSAALECAWERAAPVVAPFFLSLLRDGECPEQLELESNTLECASGRCSIVVSVGRENYDRIELAREAGVWKVLRQVRSD